MPGMRGTPARLASAGQGRVTTYGRLRGRKHVHGLTASLGQSLEHSEPLGSLPSPTKLQSSGSARRRSERETLVQAPGLPFPLSRTAASLPHGPLSGQLRGQQATLGECPCARLGILPAMWVRSLLRPGTLHSQRASGEGPQAWGDVCAVPDGLFTGCGHEEGRAPGGRMRNGSLSFLGTCPPPCPPSPAANILAFCRWGNGQSAGGGWAQCVGDSQPHLSLWTPMPFGPTPSTPPVPPCPQWATDPGSRGRPLPTGPLNSPAGNLSVGARGALYRAGCALG